MRNKNLWQKIYINGIKRICIFFLELDCYLRKFFFVEIRSLPKNEDLPVISLTTFPARIKSLWMVIDSIFQQTVKPQKIIVTLAYEEFPKGIDSVPNSLKRYLDKGLEIVFTDYNLRSHNKYYYALSHIIDKDLITIDDDLYYWPDTIERLVNLKKDHPECICANRTLQIVLEANKLEYRFETNCCSHALMAQGVGGVLYVPEFRPQNLFDKIAIKKHAITNDDNWLKVHEILNGNKVVTGDLYPHPLLLLGSQKNALMYDNIKGKSIAVLYNLIDIFKLDLEMFKKE